MPTKANVLTTGKMLRDSWLRPFRWLNAFVLVKHYAL
jgi:hypothetical protein